MSGSGWLAVWQMGAAGDCACPRRYACPRPGKHPVWVRETSRGFEHGALSAVATREEAVEIAGSAAGVGRWRLAVVPGDGLLVVDIDGDRAWRSFVRYLSGEIGNGELLGVAKTPRGWHVYLGCAAGGWDAGSMTAWLRAWLGGSLRGLEIRCGTRAYVVCPGGSGDDLDGRRWVSPGEFAAAVDRDWVELPVVGVVSSWAAPWRVEDGAVVGKKTLGAWQQEHVGSGGGGSAVDLVGLLAGGCGTAMARLEAALVRLAGAADGTRNNMLNAVAFYQGAEAWWAAEQEGVSGSRQEIVDGLARAYWGEKPWDRGGRATIESGLKSGWERLAKAASGGVVA